MTSETSSPNRFFAESYQAARQAFRQQAVKANARVDSYTYPEVDQQGDSLTVDLAELGSPEAEKVLLITSGLHGIEGFMGSAAQLQFLESWQGSESENLRVVMVHALNPYGFAYYRREDAAQIDSNRNFILPHETFAGAPLIYQAIDPFLNPQQPLSRWNTFYLQAIYYVWRYGFAAIKEAIAGGQYEYEQGLFFGGKQPSETQKIVSENWSHWIGSANQVLHLDYHTGLGKSGQYVLMSGVELTDQKQKILDQYFQNTIFAISSTNSDAYQASGDFGLWAHHHSSEIDYHYFCLEFGTYGPMRVLQALRNENSHHHWGTQKNDLTHWTKRDLKEAFCPASDKWKTQVMDGSAEATTAAIAYLRQADP